MIYINIFVYAQRAVAHRQVQGDKQARGSGSESKHQFAVFAHLPLKAWIRGLQFLGGRSKWQFAHLPLKTWIRDLQFFGGRIKWQSLTYPRTPGSCSASFV